MDAFHLKHILMAGLLTTVALAGCAAPEEAGPGDDGVTDGNGPGAPADVILIDQRPYECDDTIQTQGFCEEWVHEEDADATGAQSYTSNTDGTVEIDGRMFVCEDQENVNVEDDAQGPTPEDVGFCEKYVHQSEE